MRARSVTLLAAATFLVAMPASAHTRIKDPPPIGGAADLKLGPCGCSFEPNVTNPCPASYPITTLEAGSQVTVTWTEMVNHDGMFRVAFSTKTPETATIADLDGGVLWEGTDMNTTVPGDISQVVTVPDTVCDKCTLQVRQLMTGAVNPYYFSCAGVRIVPPGSGVGGSGASSGAASTSAGPSSATAASVGSGAASGSPQYTPEPDDGGCRMTSANPRDATDGVAVLIGLVLARTASRRRRGQPLRP